MGGKPVEVAVEHPQQAGEHRSVLTQRLGAEVLVHLVAAGQHLTEVIFADGQHQAEAHSRPHRVAAAHPIPEAKHVVDVDAEGRHRLRIGGHRHEVLRHPGLIIGPVVVIIDGFILADGIVTVGAIVATGRWGHTGTDPFLQGVSVGEGFVGGEGLRHDDHQGGGRIGPVDGGGDTGRIDVGHKPALEAVAPVAPKRPVGHLGAQVRATNANVDDGADRFAGGSNPIARVHPFGEVGHGGEHPMHLGHHIVVVDRKTGTLGAAQRHVPNSPILG